MTFLAYLKLLWQNYADVGTTSSLSPKFGCWYDGSSCILTSDTSSAQIPPTLATVLQLPMAVFLIKVARWQNWIPSFPWIAPGWRAWGRNPRKGRDQILHRSGAEP